MDETSEPWVPLPFDRGEDTAVCSVCGHETFLDIGDYWQCESCDTRYRKFSYKPAKEDK